MQFYCLIPRLLRGVSLIESVVYDQHDLSARYKICDLSIIVILRSCYLRSSPPFKVDLSMLALLGRLVGLFSSYGDIAARRPPPAAYRLPQCGDARSANLCEHSFPERLIVPNTARRIARNYFANFIRGGGIFISLAPPATASSQQALSLSSRFPLPSPH